MLDNKLTVPIVIGDRLTLAIDLMKSDGMQAEILHVCIFFAATGVVITSVFAICISAAQVG